MSKKGIIKKDDFELLLSEMISEDSEFEQEFEKEKERLDLAVLVMELRKELNLTQEELAQKTGKPQSTIARIENGNMNPTVRLLTEIGEGVGKHLKISFV